MSVEMMITLGLSATVLVILAILMGMVLGWASQAFYVAVDPRVEAINGALPGANCGGCGYIGCNEFAEAIVRDACDVTLCGPGGTSCAAELATIMGVDIGEALPYRAVVHCSAVRDDRLQQREYRGELTCSAANLVSGIQGCVYGCLGLADCVVSCKYDAIHISQGLAVVDYKNCIGCRKCAQVCPRNIISMVPFKSETMLVVACSSLDMGNDVKKVCSTGCIGCSACTRKLTGDQPISMGEGRPILDYDHYDPNTIDIEQIRNKCKRTSLLQVGVPTAKDLAQVQDEEVPEVIQAQFETTVDKTEYRG